ncbi:hypothetical protein CSOJ01_08796 [Colletotrichum sojae]|uniref:Zn(2)-C6 fungal-type domain-containing protein n=1 Tax=Colletotrichum sojae TaxID=2175907 RepID=A0A8H6J4S8_9PEZI|nr:hypothetical protein CSOJ01_08796 [Colletotrichum sojae]
MPRKGSRKVRTGCITCKVRKVKCDEAKPACDRCTNTGRICDGYSLLAGIAVHAGDGWELILRNPDDVFPGAASPHEGRALQYFRDAAGPSMAGTADPHFWTHVVLQFSALQPAVRHAVIAISDLHERAAAGAEEPGAPTLLALQHYNASIRELEHVAHRNRQPVVLLVCILFVCIEFMRGDKDAAVKHCRHGVEIVRNVAPAHAWTRTYLLPIFRRLSEFAFFFGDENAEFPDLAALCPPTPKAFASFSEAQQMLDGIFNRTTKLMRFGRGAQHHTPRRTASGSFGSPVSPASVFPGHVLEEARIAKELDLWLRLFADFDARMMHREVCAAKYAPPAAAYDFKVRRCFLLTRWECCRIWLDIAFDDGAEGPSSQEKRSAASFRRVLKQLLWLESHMPAELRGGNGNRQRRPHFVFETGFGANLFFLASTCSHLETRLELLRLMSVFALPRENLWEKDVLIAAARKIIAVEHGLENLEAHEARREQQRLVFVAEKKDPGRGITFVRHDDLAVFGSYLLLVDPFVSETIET